jgi:hypothetical protein
MDALTLLLLLLGLDLGGGATTNDADDPERGGRPMGG